MLYTLNIYTVLYISIISKKTGKKEKEVRRGLLQGPTLWAFCMGILQEGSASDPT